MIWTTTIRVVALAATLFYSGPQVDMNTLRDIEVVSRVVWCESRGEPVIGQIAVAYTVLNRAKTYKTSIIHQALRPKQFCVGKRSTPRIKRIVAGVLLGVYPDPTNGALYFNSPAEGVDPPYVHGMKKKVIGNHRFYSPSFP